MTTATPAARAEQVFLALVALALPSLSLVILGGLYLWDKGWLLYWALATLASVGAVALLHGQLSAKPTVVRDVAATEAADIDETALSDPRWSDQERLAWADVQRLAAGVAIERLSTTDGALAVAAETIEAVAQRLHPGTHDAVWQFTLPEALAISERVSRRLGGFVVTHVPFGDKMTVSQFLTIYRARQLVDVAGRAYDIWRIVRLVNPATAMTNEARERLTKALFSWGREHVSRRVVSAYIEEVGRASIDLYGGRLRKAVPAAVPPGETETAPAAGEPPAATAAVRQAVTALGRLIRSTVSKG